MKTRYEVEYQTIKKLEKKGFKITLICDVLTISLSAYYKWLNRQPTESEKRLRHLIEVIQTVYQDHKEIYGYRRMTIYLNRSLHAQLNYSGYAILYRLGRRNYAK